MEKEEKKEVKFRDLIYYWVYYIGLGFLWAGAMAVLVTAIISFPQWAPDFAEEVSNLINK